MPQLLLASSTVALGLLMAHSWRTRGRFVTLAFFLSGIAFGMIRGNVVWLLLRGLGEDAAVAKPYLPPEGLIPPIGHESLQVAVGWVFALYLAWTVSELILRRLGKGDSPPNSTKGTVPFSGRVFMIAGLSSLFILAICWVMETTAVAAGWWYWALPTRTALFGNVNVPAMEGWFSVVPDFLVPFLVIVCAATTNRWKWLWFLAFPLHMLAHLAYRWFPYAYVIYNVMELTVVALMMFSRLGFARGEMKPPAPGGRVSGALFASALVIFFGVIVAANAASNGGAAGMLTAIPMLMLCLLAWRRLPWAAVAACSLAGTAGWIALGPPALWALTPIAAFGFLALLHRLGEAAWLRILPPAAVVALSILAGTLQERDMARAREYLCAWAVADRLEASGAPRDEVEAAYRGMEQLRPKDIVFLSRAVREMAAPGTTDAIRAAGIFQRRLPRLVHEMTEVVRRDPDWLSPNEDLAHYELIRGNLAFAEETYRRMMLSHRGSGELMAMLAYFQLRMRDLDGAERTCKLAMKLRTPPPAAEIDLGVVRLARGRRDEARGLWLEAIKRDPGLSIAALNLDRLVREPTESEVDDRFLARPSVREGLSDLVSALALHGEDYTDGERRRLLEEASQLDPDAPLPHEALAKFYLANGPRNLGLWHQRRFEALSNTR